MHPDLQLRLYFVLERQRERSLEKQRLAGERASRCSTTGAAARLPHLRRPPRAR
ncbi:MAG: hypothetical protein GX593_05010 [Actinomycetales bacterium]|nr:hypothetical protein [Actinomycetales bacterium]